MFSKDMLIGILISSAKVSCRITRNDAAKIGYEPFARISLRGEKDFVEAFKRSMLHWNVYCNIKDKESNSRPKPILTIAGYGSLKKIIDEVPDLLPTRQEEWALFRKFVQMVVDKKHLTQKGLDELLELMGYINGINDNE